MAWVKEKSYSKNRLRLVYNEFGRHIVSDGSNPDDLPNLKVRLNEARIPWKSEYGNDGITLTTEDPCSVMRARQIVCEITNSKEKQWSL